MRPTRISQVTDRLDDAPNHIRRTATDPPSEAVLRSAINVVAARRTAWRRRTGRPDRARTAHHARRALRQRLVGGEPDWLGEARPASCRARRRPLNVAASRHAAPAVADWTQYDWRRERCCALRLWIHGCSSCSAHGSRRRPPTAPQGAPVPLRADCPARCACTPEPEGSGPRLPRVYRQRSCCLAALTPRRPRVVQAMAGETLDMANYTGGFEVSCKRAVPKIALEPAPLPSRLRRRHNLRKPGQCVRCGVQLSHARLAHDTCVVPGTCFT